MKANHNRVVRNLYNKNDLYNLSIDEHSFLMNVNYNTYVFALFKAYNNARDLNDILYNIKKNNGTFADFKAQAKKINLAYNYNYLNAEFNSAIAIGQMAEKWQNEISVKKGYWRYDSVGDGRVRKEHAMLDGTVKKWDDIFWKNYYPTNGWNCRCAVTFMGPYATEVEPKSFPKVTPPFDNNCGATGFIFSENHPYYTTIDGKTKERLLRRYNPFLPPNKKEVANRLQQFNAFLKNKDYKLLSTNADNVGFAFEHKDVEKSYEKYNNKKEYQANIRMTEQAVKKGLVIEQNPYTNKNGQKNSEVKVFINGKWLLSDYKSGGIASAISHNLDITKSSGKIKKGQNLSHLIFIYDKDLEAKEMSKQLDNGFKHDKKGVCKSVDILMGEKKISISRKIWFGKIKSGDFETYIETLCQ